MPGRNSRARLRRRSSAWPVIELPWVRYARGRGLLWRIKIPAGGARPRPADEEIAAARAHGRRVRQRWATEAAPSPANWAVPPGVRPAWNWAPPDGLVPRLDRVPAWVRLWYRTPFVDRYAHSWMWWHGGWDVLRREAER